MLSLRILTIKFNKMTELQKRAKKYLVSKGVKSTGDKFIALDVLDMLCEFAKNEQCNIANVVGQSEQLPKKVRECQCVGMRDKVVCGFECYDK